MEKNVFAANQVVIETLFYTATKSYTVTGKVTWTPTFDNNGQSLCCDVYHAETLGKNNPQTVCLQLTVQCKKEF